MEGDFEQCIAWKLKKTWLVAIRLGFLIRSLRKTVPGFWKMYSFNEGRMWLLLKHTHLVPKSQLAGSAHVRTCEVENVVTELCCCSSSPCFVKHAHTQEKGDTLKTILL